ncbi:HipA domain-containing protein [Rhizobium rhizophilum]|uniref:HipA domain-containing protein n=1 Tax=Rhizobium rhizophilum TaxID=1850373 RepID=UPI0019801011|nr:HipA domain-containing protein [Rhizobium rhizophilum]
MFHYLIGNADDHAKNYALLYSGKAPDLAPMYDAICTAAYPRLSKKMAMSLCGRSLPDTIRWSNGRRSCRPTKPRRACSPAS